MFWISGDAEVVIAPEFGDVGEGDCEDAIIYFYKPGIKEGEPGNAVVIEETVEHLIPAALEFIEGDIASAH